jgi:predicted TIM-barrel fold metal-dependent hydrolase
MIALMSLYPGVYVDVAALQSEALLPHAAYYRHLRALVEAGFGKRIMFGSDFPDQVAVGIDAILAADFLNCEQKSDILCNNAARFLRLDPSPCAAP